MKILSTILILSFGIKCLISFMIGQGSIGDGVFLIAVILYCFTMLDLKLPQDE